MQSTSSANNDTTVSPFARSPNSDQTSALRPISPQDLDMTSSKSSIGTSLLHQYPNHIDQSQRQEDTHVLHEDKSGSKTITPILENPQDEVNVKTTEISVTPGGFTPSLQPRSFISHRGRNKSTDIPRQTILKALASKSAGILPGPLTALPSMNGLGQSSREKGKDGEQCQPSTSGHPANLQLNNVPGWSPTSANLLRSPCFFHQRFDGIVDIQKVLEEMSEDDYSHSRLMQTATGVREVSKQLQRKPIKRAVKNVMIVTKARDNKLVCLTRDLAEWLLSTPRYGSELGVNAYVDAKLKHSKRFGAAELLRKSPRFNHMLKYWTPDLCWTSPEKFDLVLTLGGDGTVLFTSWLFQRVVPPVLSFSLGSLGFLTNFEFDRYKDHLDKIMGDAGMRVNLRMRFTCTVWRKDHSPGAHKDAVEEGEQFEVLNELVIDRGPSAYVSNLELYGDDELLTIVQADGCIFSTPTGSTAYSLSAGGSLIHPSIPAILLTPICPHTLSFRPMVLSDTLALRIAVPAQSRSTAYCSFDGKGRIELERGDYVTLEASQYPFPTVMSGTNEWISSVQRALRWNVRGAVQKGWEEGNEDEAAEEAWDIDTDPYPCEGTDSGIGPSEDGEAGTASPMRRQMSLLAM